MNKWNFRSWMSDFFVCNFDVRQDKEDEQKIIESISKGVKFKGPNLWVLIFSTFIASFGFKSQFPGRYRYANISPDGVSIMRFGMKFIEA